MVRSWRLNGLRLRLTDLARLASANLNVISVLSA
jgi:hypothetical protein